MCACSLHSRALQLRLSLNTDIALQYGLGMQICHRTAAMVSGMMAEGFVHGVLNSDNLLISVLALILPSCYVFATQALPAICRCNQLTRLSQPKLIVPRVCKRCRAKCWTTALLPSCPPTSLGMSRPVSTRRANTRLVDKWRLAAGICSALDWRFLCCLSSFRHRQQRFEGREWRMTAVLTSRYHRWKRCWCDSIQSTAPVLSALCSLLTNDTTQNG